MYGRERSLIIGTLLLFLSVLYGLIVRLRLLAYRLGLFHARVLPVPVLSVGNITLGGTGKTPTVIHLAELLRGQGKRPLVLSRGYGRDDVAEILVVSDDRSVLQGPGASGDEPAMIAHRLPGVPVVVGKDRYRAGALAIERFHPDVVLLDDGFQHLPLHRDVNIVLVDGADPVGRGRLFPAGILREPLSSLGRADVVVITRADQAADLDGLKRSLQRFTRALIVSATYRPTVLLDVATGRSRPLEVLRGSSVLAFAGIARPESLELALTSLGAHVLSLRTYPDHYQYSHKDLKVLLEEASRTAALLVTTEKDGVKLKGMAPAGIWMLRIDLDIAERTAWEEAVCLRS